MSANRTPVLSATSPVSDVETNAPAPYHRGDRHEGCTLREPCRCRECRTYEASWDNDPRGSLDYEEFQEFVAPDADDDATGAKAA